VLGQDLKAWVQSKFMSEDLRGILLVSRLIILVGSEFPMGPKQTMLGWFSSGIIMLPLRFWKWRRKWGTRLKGLEGEWKTNATDEERRRTSGISEMDAIAGGDGPWTWIFKTLESCDGGGRTDVFSSKREGAGATGNVTAERKVEIFITRAQGQSGNLILCLFGRRRFV